MNINCPKCGDELTIPFPVEKATIVSETAAKIETPSTPSINGVKSPLNLQSVEDANRALSQVQTQPPPNTTVDNTQGNTTQTSAQKQAPQQATVNVVKNLPVGHDKSDGKTSTVRTASVRPSLLGSRHRFVHIGLVVLCILGVSGAALWWWMTTPSYCLWQLGRSIDQKDFVAFERWVNLPQVLSTAADELLGNTWQQVDDQTRTWGTSVRQVAGEAVDKLKPQLTQLAVEQIKTRLLQSTSPPGDQQRDGLCFLLTDLCGRSGAGRPGVLKLVEIRRDRDTAQAQVRFICTDGQSRMATLILHRKEKRWQVAQISNLAELLALNKSNFGENLTWNASKD
jgi:hypothetical protein